MLSPFERLRAIYISIGLFLYFCVFFLVLVHEVEENAAHPYQGTVHDKNGTAISPR
jgi:hypothetical protein